MLYPVPIRNDQPCLGAFTFDVVPGVDGKHQVTNKIGAFAKGQAVTGIRLVITQKFDNGDPLATDLTVAIGLGAYTKNGSTTAANPTFFLSATELDNVAVNGTIDAGALLKLIPDFDGEQVDLTLTFASATVAPTTWGVGKLKGFVTLVEQI